MLALSGVLFGAAWRISNERPLRAIVAAVALGAYGVLYHGMMISVFAGAVAQEDIGVYSMTIVGFLFFVVVAMGFNFKGAMSPEA